LALVVAVNLFELSAVAIRSAHPAPQHLHPARHKETVAASTWSTGCEWGHTCLSSQWATRHAS